MAWTSGQVNPGVGEEGYDLLLTELRDFLTTNSELVAANQNWIVEKEETISTYSMSGVSYQPTYTGDFRDIYLRGPGLAQQDNIFVNLRAYQSAPSSIYNWYISGATSFDTGDAWEEQAGNNIISYPCTFTLVNSLIDYWFVANGRRFIVICKIEGDFYAAYNGLFLPYGLPSEYPYPHFISGTGQYPNVNQANSGNRNFFNIGAINRQQANVRLTSSRWAQVGNNDYGGGTPPRATVWPWFMEAVGGAAYNLVGNLDGSFSLLPAVLVTGEDSESVLGDLHGVYYAPGTGQVDLSAEDTITIGADTYLVIQNAALSDRTNYAAIKLE